MSRGGEVIAFPRIAGVQWSNTVGSTLWEGGGHRSRPGYRPWSCRDRADVLPAPAGGVVVAGVWSSIYGAVAFSGALQTRVLHAPAVVVARDGPGPPGRSAGVHTRRSGGHVEVPDS